jgi:LPS sulfotransferase NodH
MNIPPPLRALESPHRAALERAFGPIRPVPGWVAPDVDVLFLCFTNRSGSNYLAHLLAGTGAFNEAGEFFNAATVLEHAAPRGLASLPAYFSLLPDLVQHPGRLAMKAAADQLVMLADAGILAALGQRAHYLLLERQDRLGQAISRVIAAQTGRWTTAHAPTALAAPRYDRAAIVAELAKIEHGNAALYLFFAANRMAPIHTTYESVLRAPQGAIDRVSEAMGLAGLRADPALVPIGRQADGVNAAWRADFERGA